MAPGLLARLTLEPLRRIYSGNAKLGGVEAVLFQRLFWGAMTGCLATVLLAESPVLESMELNLIEWRYKVAHTISKFFTKPALSKDITLIKFDDLSQFELGIAHFNDDKSQNILARALAVIERGAPAMVVIDLDLRGADCTKLDELLKHYHNIILALFGSLEGSTDLPAANFLCHAAAYGYDDLPRESNGLVCRLPINIERKSDLTMPLTQSTLLSLPTLAEATIDLHRKIKGVGPSSQIFAILENQPLYAGFRQTIFTEIPLKDLLQSNFDPAGLRNRIVFIGSTCTQRKSEQKSTALEKDVPDSIIHARSIACLIDNDFLRSFPASITHHLLILLGAIFGAFASILPLGRRFIFVAGSAAMLILIGQTAFQFGHQVIPIASPLCVLILTFILGTLIYLDTDLRQRNRELAQARESMQVRAEEERQRIAEDLHDESLPALSSVARLADRLAGDLKDNPIPLEMRSKLDHAVDEMRRVINDLHPSVLETMGFKPALENLVNTLSRECALQSDFIDSDGAPDYPLPDFTKLQLYRIVQEGLNNVLKHAQAKKVKLNIEAKNGNLTISLSDDGRGIDPKLIRRDAHGLLNIRQRAQLIGARVQWNKPAQFGRGTELKLQIPLPTEQMVQ